MLSEQHEQTKILDVDQNIQNYLEVKPVSTQAVREYLLLLWKQYQEANRKLKSKILDEIVKNTGMHRCSAKRLMGKTIQPAFKRGRGKSSNIYSDGSKEILAILWKDMGYLGAVRMKAAIPAWIEYWEHKDLDDLIKHELKTMSASTIERTLKKCKSELRRKLNTGTQRSDSKAKTMIPIRNLEKKPNVIGHCEIDCVAHCGGSLSGSHIWTLTVTDIVSGHTECEALEKKNGFEVQKALHKIEDRLPFILISLYMDNGSEFINSDVLRLFSLRNSNRKMRKNPIALFRSRPYKKNDQCFVEQKNYTHVRELFGYDRLTGPYMVNIMNGVYRKEWRLLANYYHPQIRLKSKERIGAKVKRKFYKPQTPYSVLQTYLDRAQADMMTCEYKNLNPFSLRKSLKKKLRYFQSFNKTNPKKYGKYAF